jgi:hypothetical protein
LFGDVCSKFNITVPVVGSNSSANGTNVTFVPPSSTPTPTIVPSKGGAAASLLAKGDGKAVAIFGVFVAAYCFYGLGL